MIPLGVLGSASVPAAAGPVVGRWQFNGTTLASGKFVVVTNLRNRCRMSTTDYDGLTPNMAAAFPIGAVVSFYDDSTDALIQTKTVTAAWNGDIWQATAVFTDNAGAPFTAAQIVRFESSALS